MLNPVLLGYWCNLFRSLVQTHPQEVFIYFYEHEELIDKMLNHLYSPQMSDIFVRLLNFNESVFKQQKDEDSMNEDDCIGNGNATRAENGNSTAAITLTAAKQIR